MKQLFSHIGEQAEQIHDLWKKGNKQGQPYNCTILPGGNFQAAVQKKVKTGTQTDPRSLLELKSRYWPRQVEFSRQITRKKGVAEKERALELYKYPQVFGWVLLSSCVKGLSCVWLFAAPWITARQASLSITNSRSSLRLTPIAICYLGWS